MTSAITGQVSPKTLRKVIIAAAAIGNFVGVVRLRGLWPSGNHHRPAVFPAAMPVPRCSRPSPYSP